MGKLPDGTTVSKESVSSVDLIQVFVSSRQQLEELLSKIRKLISKDELLLVSYPKGKLGINRIQFAPMPPSSDLKQYLLSY